MWCTYLSFMGISREGVLQCRYGIFIFIYFEQMSRCEGAQEVLVFSFFGCPQECSFSQFSYKPMVSDRCQRGCKSVLSSNFPNISYPGLIPGSAYFPNLSRSYPNQRCSYVSNFAKVKYIYRNSCALRLKRNNKIYLQWGV